MAKIIDGKAVSKAIKDEVKQKVEELQAKGITVTLAVIQVGNNQASTVYVNNKKKACEYTGIHMNCRRKLHRRSFLTWLRSSMPERM